MAQQFPMALQVALYAASCAIIVLACVLVYVLLRLRHQLDRTVTAVEHLEAQLTPLAREARVVVGRLSDLAEGVQRVVGVAGGLLLPPVRAVNRAAQLLQTGATTFVQALWNGRQERG
jgi:uncharacterized protein YoxC